MQKWSYLTLTFGAKKFGVCTVDGKEMAMNEAFNYVGQFGWELVTVTSRTETSAVFYAMFKRPQA